VLKAIHFCRCRGPPWKLRPQVPFSKGVVTCPDDLSDQKLVARLIAGKADAWRLLFEYYGEALLAHARRLLRQRRYLALSAHDVAAEVWNAFHSDKRKVRAFDKTKGTLDAYLNKLADEQVGRLGRRKDRPRESQAREASLDVLIERHLENPEFRDFIEVFAKRLTPYQRQYLLYVWTVCVRPTASTLPPGAAQTRAER
jgi:DNA-directed RNA polymerase specialized sigma24 family protein